ncbi:MAG TPA: response regulator [Candidatus Hydrogenedentes bacterium]|nr:response regulator [Candidatus Hydrogenedentota bacterium]
MSPQNFDTSDSSVDFVEPSSLGRQLDRFRRLPYDKGIAMRWVVLALAVCALVEIVARLLFEYNFIGAEARDLSGFVSLAVLLAVGVYVFARVHTAPMVRIAIFSGVVCGIVFQVFDIIDELSWGQAIPLLAKDTPSHRMLEQTTVIFGSLLLLAGFCFALLENEEILRELQAERKRLFENIAERRRAKRALKDAHRALEAKVQERTAALAEVNEQLRVELGERRRAEATLANRLRIEEGLAACSHMLLASGEPEEALNKALHQLLTISGASHVYVFENDQDPELGLCMRMTHQAWDPAKVQWHHTTAPVRVAYTPGFERWQQEMAYGKPIAGSVENLPEAERVWLTPYGAQAVLLLPIGWEGQWRGFLGFDETQTAHGWSTDEIRVLQTAAEMVSACRERQRAEESLRHAFDSLERRVAERTADLTRTNEQLQQEMAERQRAEQDKARLESQLIQGQKMQAIGTLAGGIAHDFNNILSSILGFSELALRKLEPNSPFQRHFNEILKAGNRAKELVRQILIFSRQTDQERTAVHVHLIAKETLALLRASTPANIEVRAYIDANAGAVFADPGQMHQVFLNLCTNAQHAMRITGGVLELRVEPIRVDIPIHTPHGDLESGEYVRLSVSDTGHGMDAQTIERIFEPFFTTKGVGEGTGMGLAILHGIVTSLKGVVAVESQVGKGSLFQVYLPRYQGEEPAKGVAMEVLRGSEHILVLDDEPQLVGLWTEMLGQLGYQITPFCDSLAALQCFRDAPFKFDLVLMDQMMPGMTGMQVAQAMLKERPDLPIILATGFSESVSPEDAREAGIRDFVYKPILGNELGLAVRKALDKGEAQV